MDAETNELIETLRAELADDFFADVTALDFEISERLGAALLSD